MSQPSHSQKTTQNAIENSSRSKTSQTLIGAGALLIACVMAYGATFISSAAGYAGIGPNFIPWFVAIGLAGCGIWLIFEAQTKGYQKLEEPSGAAKGDWTSMLWVAAGLLLNALLIERVGFILSCSLCFVLAVRGFRISEARAAGSLTQTLKDIALGITIAAPVFWMFTKALKINLPGVTGTGWL